MIGLDTNVLLRALTRDDPVQSPAATRILSELTPERPGYVNLIVLAETAWNLRRKYRAGREAVFDAVESLLESRSVVVADRPTVVAGLELARAEGLDFADALIAMLNRHAGCETTLTFDGRAAESSTFKSAF